MSWLLCRFWSIDGFLMCQPVMVQWKRLFHGIESFKIKLAASREGQMRALPFH